MRAHAGHPPPPTSDHPPLDLHADVVDLAAAVVDVESVSGGERALADLVEQALRAQPHLEVLRDGDAVVARTTLGRPERVVLAGHLDTVPPAGGDLPSRRQRSPGGEELLVGRGSADMKGGVAVALALAGRLVAPRRDVTYAFYDHEEVDSSLNGLRRLVEHHPQWLAGDVAVLGEPTSAAVEGGCNGTLRVEVVVPGRAAHSARSWVGVNAIHAAAPVLATLAAYRARTVDVDGLAYREGLNAVGIRGGIAGNVIPDECVVVVNHRFAPSATPAQAEAHVREVFDGFEVRLADAAPGARPGLDAPAVAALVDVVRAAGGGEPVGKVGWTDVARFSALGVPAVNFGPGDPLAAHTDGESCRTAEVRTCLDVLAAWLG